jgi:uncharacterized delta-60 repeat protein
MATKNFTQFDLKTPLLTSDYIVGYKTDGSAEFRATVKQVVDLVQDSDSQTLSFNEANKQLTISKSNSVVSLSTFTSNTELKNNDLVVKNLSATQFVSYPEPYRKNLFSRIVTNDTALYKGPLVLNNWLRAENGLYYHPLRYWDYQTNQYRGISANFGLSYNFSGLFTYILSAGSLLNNFNFDFDLISNIQYVESNKSFIIGEGFGYSSGQYSDSISIKDLAKINDRYIVGGNFNYFNNAKADNIAMLSSNGSRDFTFASSISTGINSSIQTVAIDSNNKILIGGDFTSYNGIPINSLIRLNYDGSIDTSLSAVSGVGGFENLAEINTVTIDNNNKILIGGYFGTYNNIRSTKFIRLNYDGSIDTSLSAVSGDGILRFNTPDRVRSIFIDNNNKIVIGGYITTYNSIHCGKFIRLNHDGSIDTTLSAVSGNSRFPSATFDTRAIIHGLNSSYIIGGYFTTYNNQNNYGLIRLNYDGSVDTSLSAVPGQNRFSDSPTVNTVVLQPDSKIVVGGDFTEYNYQDYNRIIRLNYDGSIDTSFTVGTGFNNSVNKILLLDNGKLLIGGYFTSYNGQNVRGLALLNSDGTLDTTAQEKFISRIKYKVTAFPGAINISTGNETVYDNFTNTFLPTVQDGQICIGSVQPISFGSLDYTLMSNYGSGTIGFGSS